MEINDQQTAVEGVPDLQQEDVRVKFQRLIEKKGVKYKFVATGIGISPGHLTNILGLKRVLTQDIRAKLNTYLEVQF